MKNRDRGVSLIELLIVISIIGILGTIALPYYQGYMLRTRLIEVENTMAIVKSAVSSYRMEKETSWPDCPTINEIRNSLGVGLGGISRISEMSVDPVSGAITARVLNVHPMVDGETITLTPALASDNSFTWNWGWSAGFPFHLRTKR